MVQPNIVIEIKLVPVQIPETEISWDKFLS